MPSPKFPEVPQNLAVLKPYLKIANLHDDRDLVVSYWCRLEAIQRGLQLSSRSMEETQFCIQVMQWLEKTKKENHDNEAITNQVVAQAHLENWALKLFLYADENDRAGVFNKSVIQAFYTSSIIYQLLQTFGPLNDEAERNMKYAKWKSVYINNCLKNGETPVSGPLETEDDDFNLDDYNEIEENIDEEHLDAVTLNFSVENNEEEGDNDNPVEDYEGENKTEGENANPNETENEIEENNIPEDEIEAKNDNEEEENQNEITENEEENNIEEEENENQISNTEEENKNEEENENLVTENEEVNKNEEKEESLLGEEGKNVEDYEKTEKSVAEPGEENDEKESSSKDAEFTFPSVPSSGADSSTKDLNTNISSPVTPNQYNPAPTPTNGSSTSSFDKDNLTVKVEGGVELTPEQMVRAQKLIKWAGSALNYDDVPTAVTNLRQALNLLTTGQENA